MPKLIVAKCWQCMVFVGWRFCSEVYDYWCSCLGGQNDKGNSAYVTVWSAELSIAE